MEDFDIIIIGGGIAGVSAAAFLAPRAKVVVLEREADIFYHSSSRSTSQYTVGIHAPTMRRLAQASRSFLTQPAPTFSETGFLSPRGCLAVGRQDQRERLLLLKSYLEASKARCEMIGQQEIGELFPALHRDQFPIGVYEPDAMDIDSDRLMGCYLQQVKKHKSEVRTRIDIQKIEKIRNRWYVRGVSGDFSAPMILNAAGAWADEISLLSGLQPVGLTPYMRNAFSFVAPWEAKHQIWPHLYSVTYNWYIHPQNSYFIGSLADTTPTTAGDVYPQDLAVAQAIENIHQDTEIKIQRPLASWAGLRTFCKDRAPAIGASAQDKSYFYVVGLGGCGILTSPAVGSAIASLMLGKKLPSNLMETGLDEAQLSPQRDSLS